MFPKPRMKELDVNLLKEEIIHLIPSESLKQKIRDVDYSFSNMDLLKIAYTYAPSFSDRIQYMEKLVAEAPSIELATYIRWCIERQLCAKEQFIRMEPNTVYELHIKETPDAYDEIYICASYSAALECIRKFYEEYRDVGAAETDISRYKMIKRTLFTDGTDTLLSDDYRGECEWRGRVLYSVELADGNLSWACGSTCCDSQTCEKMCMNKEPLCFPCIAQDKELVRFIDAEGNVRFGINRKRWDEDTSDSCYILPLDADVICHGAFEELPHIHEQHIDMPLVEKVSIDMLDARMKADYFACIEYLEREN